MDARARLQRYLEQRRELGESELVLDTMSVEEVMALVGAKASPRSTGKPSRRERPSTPTTTTLSEQAPVRDAPERDAPERDAPVRDAPVRDAPDAEAESVAVTVQSPAVPPTRFDANAPTDWRQTLRDTQPVVANEPTSANAPERGHASTRGASGADAGHSVVLPTWLESIGWAGGIDVRIADHLPEATDHIHTIAALPDLDAIAQHIRACTRCALYSGARNAVPGEGNGQADLMCVGEGPGASEDEQGRPFVGESGELLTKILDAIHLPREAVYICNVVKHRPPGNRDPLPEEVRACAPYLQRQVSLVKPRVILALGRVAAQTLLRTTLPLGKLRQQIHMYNGVPVIATYHPAALLRNEAWKRPTWKDVKVARSILDLSRTADGGTTPGQHVD